MTAWPRSRRPGAERRRGGVRRRRLGRHDRKGSLTPDYGYPRTLTRITATGALDTTFGTSGFTSQNSPSAVSDVFADPVRPRDRIVTAQRSPYTVQPQPLAMFGFTSGGAPAAEIFGTAGELATPRSCATYATAALAVDSIRAGSSPPEPARYLWAGRSSNT